MCFNCGCGIPNDPMGKGKVTEGGASLTEDDIKIMSGKWGMSIDESKRNILELLNSQIKQK